MSLQINKIFKGEFDMKSKVFRLLSKLTLLPLAFSVGCGNFSATMGYRAGATGSPSTIFDENIQVNDAFPEPYVPTRGRRSWGDMQTTLSPYNDIRINIIPAESVETNLTECNICLRSLIPSQNGEKYLTPDACKHASHEKCLEIWLARSKTCPVCKEIIETGAIVTRSNHVQLKNN